MNMLWATIKQHRPASFQLLLSRMNFNDPSSRSMYLTDFLAKALQERDMEIVEMLFEEGFEITRWCWYDLMDPDWVEVPWTFAGQPFEGHD